MRIRQELSIRRGPEAVFRWIEDPALARRWQPEVLDHEILRAAPGVAGTEFREVLGDPGGSVVLRGRVTGYQANAMMSFELRGRGLLVRARYQLSPAGRDTRLLVETDLRLGGWLSFLIAPFARGKIEKRQRAELERLRELCEAEPRREGSADRD